MSLENSVNRNKVAHDHRPRNSSILGLTGSLVGPILSKLLKTTACPNLGIPAKMRSSRLPSGSGARRKQAGEFFDDWLERFPAWADFVQAVGSNSLTEFDPSRESAIDKVSGVTFKDIYY